MCVCNHTHTHTQTHTHTHTYVCSFYDPLIRKVEEMFCPAFTCTCKYIIHTYTHSKYTHRHTQMNVCKHTHTHTLKIHTYTYTNECMSTHTHTHTHTHTQIFTHTHTHTYAGFFYDPLIREIEEMFCPWLLDGVASNTQAVIKAHELIESSVSKGMYTCMYVHNVCMYVWMALRQIHKLWSKLTNWSNLLSLKVCIHVCM